ncbi:hypothetical protein ACHAW6_014727 [Cyclotella cf. meneghiniana]
MTGSATAKEPAEMRRHISVISMPLIEWVCVAGIPTIVCTRIVGSFPTWPLQLSCPKDEDSSNESDDMDYRTMPCLSLRWLMPLLILTSLLTLVTITLFGDDDFDANCRKVEGDKNIDKSVPPNGCNKYEESCQKLTVQPIKPRDLGVVMGSHLIPLLFMSISIFICHTNYIGFYHSSDISPGGLTCLLGEMIQYPQDAEFVCLKLASLGGLAFAASNLYVRFQHRKFISSRAQNLAYGSFRKHQPNRFQSLHNAKQMNLSPTRVCSKIYVCFLVVDLLLSSLLSTPQQQNSKCSVSFSIGVLHLFLISCHPGSSPSLKRSAYASWQNSFTPGEWMVVSTVVTTILSEFFVLHIFHLRPTNLPDHILIAHAGLTGCILGVVGISFLRKAMKEGRQSLSMSASLGIIMAITVGCLEVALETISTADDAALPASYFLRMSHCKVWFPRSIHWLAHFLSNEPGIDVVDNIRIVPPRVKIIAYWIASLAICLPISIVVASWTTKSEKSGVACSTEAPPYLLSHFYSEPAKRKRRVVLARKYFHLVGIILFSPISWLDPDMMSLSYAIAVVLMITLEMVRCCRPLEEVSHNAQGHKENKLPLDLDGSSRGLSALNQYYAVFFDEKDSLAQGGGFIVSHISLLVGCAFPLWVHQLLQYETTSKNLFTQSHCKPIILLPHIGVIALGVGDSAGALGGLSFRSPARWPGGSSRTLEGSLCMLLSMICAVGSVSYIAGLEPLQHLQSVVFTLTLLTLTEASTRQIDNLCLPVAASTLVILIASMTNRNV